MHDYHFSTEPFVTLFDICWVCRKYSVRYAVAKCEPNLATYLFSAAFKIFGNDFSNKEKNKSLQNWSAGQHFHIAKQIQYRKLIDWRKRALRCSMVYFYLDRARKSTYVCIRNETVQTHYSILAVLFLQKQSKIDHVRPTEKPSSPKRLN